jgi:hypothetical protein
MSRSRTVPSTTFMVAICPPVSRLANGACRRQAPKGHLPSAFRSLFPIASPAASLPLSPTSWTFFLALSIPLRPYLHWSVAWSVPRQDVQSAQVGAEQPARAVSVCVTSFRDTADRLVLVATSLTCCPTGSRPTGYWRVDSPESIRSIIASHAQDLGAAEQLTGRHRRLAAVGTARTHGRPHRNAAAARVTDPRWWPCRAATRSLPRLPFTRRPA